MTKSEILKALYQSDNNTVSWLANVLQCQYNKNAKMLKGLYNLANEDRVGAGNTIDQVSIDGCIVWMSELEKFAKKPYPAYCPNSKDGYLI